MYRYSTLYLTELHIGTHFNYIFFVWLAYVQVDWIEYSSVHLHHQQQRYDLQKKKIIICFRFLFM